MGQTWICVGNRSGVVPHCFSHNGAISAQNSWRSGRPGRPLSQHSTQRGEAQLMLEEARWMLEMRPRGRSSHSSKRKRSAVLGLPTPVRPRPDVEMGGSGSTDWRTGVGLLPASTEADAQGADQDMPDTSADATVTPAATTSGRVPSSTGQEVPTLRIPKPADWGAPLSYATPPAVVVPGTPEPPPPPPEDHDRETDNYRHHNQHSPYHQSHERNIQTRPPCP
jgi:hypothetical protein